MMLIFELGDEIYLVLYYINENSGFTVIGWYKWGKINDHRHETEKHLDNVESGDIGTHIVSYLSTDYLLNGPYGKT